MQGALLSHFSKPVFNYVTVIYVPIFCAVLVLSTFRLKINELFR